MRATNALISALCAVSQAGEAAKAEPLKAVNYSLAKECAKAQ